MTAVQKQFESANYFVVRQTPISERDDTASRDVN